MTNDNLHFGIGSFNSFGVIGDSYASGEIYIPNGNGGYSAKDYYEVSWGQIIAKNYGNKCINFSKGGLTTRSWLTDPMGLTLLQNSDPLSLYLCALGANDISKLGVNYIGSANDININNPSSNADTFYGNYGKIISAILEKNSNAKIIIFTIAYAYNDVEKQYNTAIRNIANIFEIGYAPLSADIYYAEDSVYKTKRVQNHPTAALYAGMAEANIRLIDLCMYNNIDYFANYIPDNNVLNIRDELTEIKASLSSFKETGGADKYISNVKVYGSPTNIGIGNIRNNYGSADAKQTGFAIFPATTDTEWGSAIKNVTNASVSGHFRETLVDGRTYEFDYDLTSLPSGTRDITRDSAHVIKQSCFYDDNALTEITEDVYGTIKYKNYTSI